MSSSVYFSEWINAKEIFGKLSRNSLRILGGFSEETPADISEEILEESPMKPLTDFPKELQQKCLKKILEKLQETLGGNIKMFDWLSVILSNGVVI